ncbi:unnamed protein product [Effrenium voratum]|nr:unnamed protein product [Effrenium voratum]
MAGCECEPRASASPENGARLCCHVDAAAVAVFAAACESQSARAFLTQLQSFCLLAAPDRDQRSCLRLGELYNSLALAAALDPALLSVHFWRALRRFFQLGTCEDLQHLALHVHESWARALGRGLKALEQDIRSTVDLWDLPVEHVRTEPGDPAECFLRDWEADRLRRERGIVGDLARLRVREAAQEDVEDTDGLDPDCFRFEARGYPSDEASTLHPPFPAKNCRAGRRFGHRFLTLRLGRPGAPLRDSFEFLRRRWRCVYWRLPDQVTYFATHGPGLEDMEVEDLMDSLVPLDANGEMSLLKYNQRLQLSFSETRAEVKLQATLREDLRDISGSFCLSDGCGSISLAKADEVAREMGLEERPGTFQARCGPFKGLWVVDPALDVDLVVRPSQLKYHSPVASEPLDFEVLRTSTKPMQSFLTSNSIQALEDLGVSPELFVRRQQEVLDALEAVLQEDAAEGRRALEALLAEQWLAPGTERQLLGFLDLEWPWREPNFQDCRFRACAALRRRACEELRLPLRRAHRAWIVPDHTRQLQKGECFLQLPGHSVSLAGREVLLIRSPCYHSSSVLKLRVPSTAPEGLQHLVNVVVLNAGERSGPADAELMCGDHDGDTVLLIWDEEMVAAVTTVESSIEDADLELRPQRKIGEVPQEKLPGLILEELTEAARSHAAFCEADRKRRDWVDDEGFGEKATRLAGICQVGVDCAASGRTVQVPEDLRQPNCPDWAKRRGPKGAVKSDKACGRLFRAELRFVRQEEVDFLSAEALGLSQWTSAQISSAVSFALGQLQRLREQRAEIHRMAYLCKGSAARGTPSMVGP